MDITAAGAVAIGSAATQGQIGVAVQRIGIEAERAVVGLIANVAEAAKATPAPGMGALLDRSV